MFPTTLVTGATGFVGALPRRCSWSVPRWAVAAAREGNLGDAGRERARRSIARFAHDVPEPAWQRCQIIPGDLTEPATLGDPRLDEVTHVLHLAGDTSLLSVRGVKRTNIDGTLALVNRMRRVPRLVRFLHVGTAYICGRQPPSLVREVDYPRANVQHIVEYTRSKAECELLLKQGYSDLPLVVARPSVVIGHTWLGCGPWFSIFWFFRTLDLLRRVPACLDAQKDIVPVDYVARALVFLLFKQQLRHDCYHISAGEVSSVSWREMAAVFARYYGERPEIPYQLADFASLTRECGRMRGLLGQGDEKLMLRVMKPFLELASIDVDMFDNRRLLEEGMPPSPRFTDYLPVCIAVPPDRSVYERVFRMPGNPSCRRYAVALWGTTIGGTLCSGNAPGHLRLLQMEQSVRRPPFIVFVPSGAGRYGLERGRSPGLAARSGDACSRERAPGAG